MRTGSRIGFTLIELSIVLVIIGLLVGGVLVGRDLIRRGREVFYRGVTGSMVSAHRALGIFSTAGRTNLSIISSG
jgi:prepilin-type N-terminal cleavage/methylation domain-containing protein